MEKFLFMFALAIALCFTACKEEYLVPDPLTLKSLETGEIIPSSFSKVYETSFEEVTIKNDNELVWDFPHWFEYAARHREDGGSGNGLGGARMWVENVRTHTGNQSIGMEVSDIEKSRRSQFVIFPKGYVGDEYYMSYWLFLPTHWSLSDPNINWDWFEIGNPYFSNVEPYSGIVISEPDEKQKYFTVSLRTRDQQGRLSIDGEKRLLLSKNRWFQVHCYVRRDKIDGAIKVWFDGQLIAEKSGFPTANTEHDNFSVSIAKIYYERGDRAPHQLWIDDFSLYSSTLK